MHSALIGKRLIEVFSSNVDEKPPTILYNELFTSNGKLKAIYGKAVSGTLNKITFFLLFHFFLLFQPVSTKKKQRRKVKKFDEM